MIKKICISIMIFVGLLIASTITATAVETVAHTDSTGDVLNADSEEVSRPNLDIEQISATKNGKEVELKLKLAEGGKIQKSTFTYVYYYGIVLITSHEEYSAMYTGLDLSVLSSEELGDYDADDLGLLVCSVMTSDEQVVDVISYAGEGEDELSIKFNLLNSNEKIIALYATTTELSDTQEFYDEYIGETLSVYVQDVYNSTTGNPISFEGDLEEGTPSDYEWVWFFEENDVLLTGVNPSHTFKIPDTYSGVVYAFDEDGNYGASLFSVNVVGKAITDNDDNGSPGFEMILLFVAIAILIGAIAIFKRK